MISFDYIKLNLSGFSSRVFSLLAIVNWAGKAPKPWKIRKLKINNNKV